MTGHRAYRNHQVKGASPIGLVLLTYDALVTAINRAQVALEAKDYALQADETTRAVRALMELITSLDHDKGGQIAASLASLYAYMYRRLMESQMDDAALTEVLRLADTLRSGWQEMAQRQGQNQEPMAKVAAAR